MKREPYEFLSRVFDYLVKARAEGRPYDSEATQIVMHLKHHAMYVENTPYMKGNRKLLKEQKAKAAEALLNALGAADDLREAVRLKQREQADREVAAAFDREAREIYGY